MDYELEEERHKVETAERWREVASKMPILHFKEKYEVKIIPPFLGAFARFTVQYNGKAVSVYYDHLSRLGYMIDLNDKPIPYFEIYPDTSGDASRWFVEETDEMMKEIERVLEG